MKRYALTHINREGVRALVRPNQARNHFDYAAEAIDYMEGVIRHNSRDNGYINIDTLQIREVECYGCGDAKGIYFDVGKDTEEIAAITEHGNYISREFDSVKTDPVYKSHIVIHGAAEGKTKFLSVSNTTLETIKRIMLYRP